MRRIMKAAGGTVRHYYLSADWQPVEERLAASSLPDRQVVRGARFVSDIVLRDRLAERLYLCQDTNASAVLLVDSNGMPRERYVYGAYGDPVFMNPSWSREASSVADWRFLFAGCSFDVESCLISALFRYLHTQLGRWLTRDPAFIVYGIYEGVQLYGYASGSPRAYRDPFGLQANNAHLNTGDSRDGPATEQPPITEWTPDPNLPWVIRRDLLNSRCSGRGTARVKRVIRDICNFVNENEGAACTGTNLRNCLQQICGAPLVLRCTDTCARDFCANATVFTGTKDVGYQIKTRCKPATLPANSNYGINVCMNAPQTGFGRANPCGSSQNGIILHELVHLCQTRHYYGSAGRGRGEPEGCERACFGKGVDESYWRFKQSPRGKCPCEC